MSFLKIRDPLKREETVKEFVALKKRIHDNQLAEKEGKLKYQHQLSRFFRPVTESQKEKQKEIAKEIGQNRITRLSTKLDEFPTLLVFEEVKLNEQENEEIGDFFSLLDLKGYDDYISNIIVNPFELSQLRRFKNKEEVDLVYGLHEKDEKLFIGNKKIDIINNSINIDKEYEGTPGLWELIVAKEPKFIYTKKDLENYRNILLVTNTLHKDNDPNNDIPKDRRMNKWKKILRFFWDEKDASKISLPLITSPIRGNEKSYHPYSPYSPYSPYLGRGITIIPSDPNALLERLDLLMASKGAGNTGVRNELVSICDELKRQRILDTKAYKKLMSKLKI